MNLKKLIVRNFRSFGNNENILEFNPDGGLFLLTGKNGHGKTSIFKSIDYCLYNYIKVKNEKVANFKLPNRINKNMKVELFYENNNDDFYINRCLEPNTFQYRKNNESLNLDNKVLQNKLNNDLTYDYDTWSSFVSMSINDFKDFVSLKEDEKKKLLDRLFNMNVITEIHNILKEKQKQFNNSIKNINSEILAYDNSINEFKSNLNRLNNIEVSDINIEELKIEGKKTNLLLTELIESKKILIEKGTNNKEKYNKISWENESLEKSLLLYNKDKCPTCSSDLTAELHTSHKDKILLDLETNKHIIDNISIEQIEIKSKINEIIEKEKEFNNIITELKNSIVKHNTITEYIKNTDGEHLNVSINNIKTKKNEKSIEKDELVLTEKYYDKLITIFKSDEIKNVIIKKIIKPINEYLQENIKLLNINFNATLNENFEVVLENYGETVYLDTLSEGENKKLNIAIMIAYIKLIRKRNFINVLFLDEIFASFDTDSVDDVLNLLKDFGKSFKINIFLVHHGLLDKSFFDEIYLLSKDVFSNIEKI